MCEKWHNRDCKYISDMNITALIRQNKHQVAILYYIHILDIIITFIVSVFNMRTVVDNGEKLERYDT